ncbi:hypothetical protein SAMN05421810_11239 [Amycolatopsis arida]|uniref:Uncharacterized protein n=1 Tax=Amycolatopsis arida TaxID=587909 RepID=A0A1I6AE05_9PSEU|nr:hypothetical protein [Amycolatopsis arida]TDX97661.1 hypothetical protein CLV69_102765 [Amycolatopsis arida]SFQ66872.1 hypothetical protein SAMN05421810_11239 [Amycolatopsis arida]
MSINIRALQTGLPSNRRRGQRPTDWTRSCPTDWAVRTAPTDWAVRRSPTDWAVRELPTDWAVRTAPTDWARRTDPRRVPGPRF